MAIPHAADTAWYPASAQQSGFIEPLESISIHLIQPSAIRLLQMFPCDGIHQPDVDEFREQVRYEVANVRDFTIRLVDQRPEHQRFIDHYCKVM